MDSSMRSLIILSLVMIILSMLLAMGGAFVYQDNDRISEQFAIAIAISLTPCFLPLFAIYLFAGKEVVKSFRWKFKRKKEWKEGDVFSLPLASKCCIGKIIGKTQNGNGNSATVAFYECGIFPATKNDTITLREENRISTIKFPAQNLDFGHWSILKTDNVVFSSSGAIEIGDRKIEQIHVMESRQILQFIKWFFCSSDSEKIKSEYFTFLSYRRQERILKL